MPIAQIEENIKNLLSNFNPNTFIFDFLLAYYTKSTDSLDIVFKELGKHYDFFLPLVGMEKAQYQNENIADIKASLKLAKLFSCDEEMVKSENEK